MSCLVEGRGKLGISRNANFVDRLEIGAKNYNKSVPNMALFWVFLKTFARLGPKSCKICKIYQKIRIQREKLYEIDTQLDHILCMYTKSLEGVGAGREGFKFFQFRTICTTKNWILDLTRSDLEFCIHTFR